MHVCALAETLGIRTALAPIHAGVLSALGMLVAPAGRQLSRTLSNLVGECTDAMINAAFAALADQGRRTLAEEGYATDSLDFNHTLDVCYRGQSYTLNIPWHDLQSTESLFHAQHKMRFGHQLDMPVEIINIRLGITAASPDIELPDVSRTTAGQCEYGHIHGIDTAVEIWDRSRLGADQLIGGPAIITDANSTTYVAPGWCSKMDHKGNLILNRTT